MNSVSSCYSLLKEVVYSMKRGSKEAYELHSQIVQNKEISVKKDDPNINTQTLMKGLAPLHLASINNNITNITHLISAGAAIDTQDKEGWTALHHAAFGGHLVIMQFLLSKGANQELTTKTGGTYKNLLDLTMPTFTVKQVLVPNGEGALMPCDAAQFECLTKARYVDENKWNRVDLLKEWSEPTPFKEVRKFIPVIRAAYIESLKTPLQHVLKSSTQACVGLGLFAQGHHAKHMPIGEYKGAIVPTGNDNPFEVALSNNCIVDGSRERNEFVEVNDGFPNLVPFCLHHIEGMATRSIFVTADAIQSGDEYCWDYGLHPVKIGPYVELRAKEARQFINSHSFEKLEQCLHDENRNREKISLEDYLISKKLSYILATPAVLFSMTFEQAIDAKTATQLNTMALKAGAIPKGAPASLGATSRYALEALKMAKKLPTAIANAYKEYVQALPAKKGILHTLKIVHFLNEALEEKIPKDIASFQALCASLED